MRGVMLGGGWPRHVDVDLFVVLLMCGHWTHTRDAEAGSYHCPGGCGHQVAARDVETDGPAILGGWEYAG